MTKILAVDDDPVIQRLLEVNLEMEGYEVQLAGDGEEALQKAREFRPDVILLDVMMPKKDGWAVCHELRQDEEFKSVPIVFLSARAQDSDVERGTEIGADAYITKPFDPIDLLDLVAELAGDD
ncbi:MAG: response regulator [Nitriliruptorales bacterium]|nr:response regulator [Nitriliruptorales bacterium]